MNDKQQEMRELARLLDKTKFELKKQCLTELQLVVDDHVTLINNIVTAYTNTHGNTDVSDSAKQHCVELSNIQLQNLIMNIDKFLWNETKEVVTAVIEIGYSDDVVDCYVSRMKDNSKNIMFGVAVDTMTVNNNKIKNSLIADLYR